MNTPDPRKRPSSVSVEQHHDIAHWLTWEAELLDSRQFDAWLGLLHRDIRYRMPVTVTTARRNNGQHPLGAMDHFDDDLHSLTQRVRRLDGEYAWTEDPPSRARRHLTSVRVTDCSNNEAHVVSNLLLFRSRGDLHPFDLLSAQRRDHLVRDAGGDWCLLRRALTIDESVLRTQNLALFL